MLDYYHEIYWESVVNEPVLQASQGSVAYDLPSGAFAVKVLLLDLSFIERSWNNSGDLFHYATSGFESSILLERFWRIPIQETAVFRISSSQSGFIRFFPHYRLYDYGFSLDVATISNNEEYYLNRLKG